VRNIMMNRYSKESGAAMIETIITFPVVMLLGFGILHLGLIYQAKSNLEYAALMAARMASTSGFYSVSNPANDFFDEFKAEVRHRMQASDPLREGAQADDAEELSKVAIRVLRPSMDVFAEFGQGTCPTGSCLIPNDNLLYRTTSLRTLPDGVEMNIQDANILQLSVSYRYNSGVPFLSRLFAVDSFDDMDAFLDESEKHETAGTPGMRITAVSTVRMQTDARMRAGLECYFEGDGC